MKVFRWQDVGFSTLLDKKVQATMGVFDGLHLGHRSLIHQVVGPSHLSSLVITFRQNPKQILHGDTYPGDLMTWQEKLAELEALGVDAVLLIDFSRDFSKMTGRDFFLQLKKSFVFSKLILGWDFSFGRNSATAASEIGWLADPDTELSIMPPVEVDGRIVSSTAIRQAVLTGDFALARRLLEQPYSITLPRDFRYRDDNIVYPVSSVHQVVPLPGEYRAEADGKSVRVVFKKDVFFWESPPDVLYKKIHFL